MASDPGKKEANINDGKIQITENGFIIKEHPFSDIKSVKIGRGKSSKYWMISSLFGGMLLTTGVSWILLDMIQMKRVQIIEVITPIFSIISGWTFLQKSMRNHDLLMINSGYQSDRIIIANDDELKKCLSIIETLKKEGISI